MDTRKISNIPYPDLSYVLETYATQVTSELKENLLGIYLVGSLATGDFDLDSDVDFLVVTESDLTESNRTNLQKIQSRIYELDYYLAKHLEVSYISRKTLNDSQSVGKTELYYFDNGSTEYEMSIHDNNWHVR